MQLPLGYSRRLVGPNLFFRSTGTVLDVPLLQRQDELITLFKAQAAIILPALEWGKYDIAVKKYYNGLRLALTAPVDITMSSCDVIDFIWLSACTLEEGGSAKSVEEAKSFLLPIINEEKNLTYRALYQESKSRGFNVFRDKNKAFIGSGKGVYQVDLAIMNINDIPWDEIYDIPAVIVTGTNGKTTTVRLTDYICRQTGKVTGYTSTDWVKVNDEVVDYGDYSGPTGHQFVLTNKNVEIALLESARGGLLKRGLVETFVNAVAVTNVSPDHLGEDGVENLFDLAEAKSIVFRALGPEGYAIINLDDEHMSKRFETLNSKKIVVSQKLSLKEAQTYMTKAHYGAFVIDGTYFWAEGQIFTPMGNVEEFPITFRGFAKHNIENSLIAICLSYSLGCSVEHIASALRTYINDSSVNQGRANVFTLKNGATAIVDFAHNAAGVTAIFNLSKAYLKEGGNTLLLYGTTGDRRNLIDDINEVILSFEPSRVILKDLMNYLRGAKVGELPKAISDGLIAKGYSEDKLDFVNSELSGTQLALQHLKPGDVAILCCHAEVAEVIEEVKKHSSHNF